MSYDKSLVDALCKSISDCESSEGKVEMLNAIRKQLHEVSPLKHHPVDCVIWEKSDNVEANEYNPNSVAPPEMELLYRSIAEDGYTMPMAVTILDVNESAITLDTGKGNRVMPYTSIAKICPRGSTL